MSNRDEMAALRSKIAQLELKQRIQRIAQTQKTELMEIKMQAALEKKDRKMELMKMQAALEKKDQERDAALEKKDQERDRESDKKEIQHQMENEKRDRLMEKKDLEQKMEKKDLEQKMEKKDLEQKMEKKDLEQKMEKKDLEQKMEKKDLEQKMELMKMHIEQKIALESEKREREADKKEAQHQINQIKWEARLGQMEQQLHAAYRIQPLNHPAQYPARANLTHKRGSEELVPQRIQVRQLERREKETGASQSAVQHSTAALTSLPSAVGSSVPINSMDASVALPLAMRPNKASVLQQEQCQPTAAQSASSTLSRRLQQQQQQQQHVAARPAAAAVKAGPVSLPDDARMHFFLSHCQGTGGDQTNAIYLELKELGFSCWYSPLES
jgi:hypothetical protein